MDVAKAAAVAMAVDAVSNNAVAVAVVLDVAVVVYMALAIFERTKSIL